MLAAVACGFYWLIFIRDYGLSFSFDSIEYMSRALAMRYAGNYYVDPLWPPLYPWLLSVIMRITPFPADAASILAGFCVAVQLYLFALIFNRITDDVIARVLAVFTLASFAPFLYMYRWVWSEVPFSLFLTAALLFFVHYIQEARARDLLWCALFVGLSVITRYIGIVAAVALAAYVLVRMRGRGNRITPRLSAAALALSWVPFLTYTIANVIRSGTLFGIRPPAEVTFGHNLGLVFTTLWGDWGVWMTILVVATVVVAVLRARRKPMSRDVTIVWAIVAVAIAYTGLLLYSTSRVLLDPIDTRFFSPLHGFAFVLVLVGFEMLVRGRPWRERRTLAVRAVFYGLMMFGIVGNVDGVRAHRAPIVHNEEIGTSHHEAGYDRSPTSHYIGETLTSILRRDGEMTAVVVHDYRDIPPRPEVGRALFYRRSTVDFDPSMSFRFADFEDGNFSLYLTDPEGTSRPIRVRTIAPPHNENELVESLDRLCRHEGVDRLWLILYRHMCMGNTAANFEKAIATYPGLTVDYDRYITPYTIHELVPRVESDTTQ